MKVKHTIALIVIIASLSSCQMVSNTLTNADLIIGTWQYEVIHITFDNDNTWVDQNGNTGAYWIVDNRLVLESNYKIPNSKPIWFEDSGKTLNINNDIRLSRM